MSDSVIALNKIKDNILPKLISGKILSIENVDNEILFLMDKISGIDYIRQDKHGLQGIAARVQWGNNWNTFTIRSARHSGSQTELEKRLYQIKHGYFYPEFTLQAYFDNRKDNNLLSIAIIKTMDLYKLYEKRPELFESNKSDNEFKYIRWNKIQNLIKYYGKGQENNSNLFGLDSDI